jgi:hypothetical protein
MDGSNYRNRLVVFRLTEEEYETLKRACAEKGARNLSEFTRSRVLGIARTDFAGAMLQKRFLAIEQQLESLQDTLGRLNQLMVARPAGPLAVSADSLQAQDARL